MELPIADTPTFPRTYRMSLAWRVFSFVAGPLLFGFGCIGFIRVGSGPTVAADILLHLLAIIMAALGAYSVVSAIVSRVVLDQESYTIISPLGHRTIRRGEIRGRREIRNPQGPGWLVFEMRSPKRRRVRIEQDFQSDPILDAWIASLPDLTQANSEPGSN